MITLITPPSEFLLDERVFMNLGILKVGASLEQAGVAVDHLDLSGVKNYMDVVADYATTHTPDCYALTATTPQMPSTSRIAAFLKPVAKVILGGPHATLVNAAARKEVPPGRASRALADLLASFDAVVAGDGERAIFRAINETGLIDADDPKSALWQTPADFNNSPWPARHLVDVDSYHYTVDGERALSLVAQLGCVYGCGYCGGRSSPSFRRMRRRSTENVIAEMLHLHKTYGVSAINFYDDELNVNPEIVALMRSIQATRIDWRLRGFVRANLFTEEQAEAMYAAGFRWLLCGFESAHPLMLRNMNKKTTVADNTHMLRIAHKYGLKVKALMSFGHPGESEETILATRDWLINEKPDDFDCTIITTYPGCPYYDSAKLVDKNVYSYIINENILYSLDVDYAHDAMYYKGKPGNYQSYVWTDHLSSERLVNLRDQVEGDVRTTLDLAYPTEQSALLFDHSMAQGLPPSILKTTIN
jgi:radical SAM superfamily enzyme YgiQ (UPF0313 family)